MIKENLLITGQLNTSVWTLAEKLLERGIHVTVAAKDLKPEKQALVSHYTELERTEAQLQQIYRSGSFQTVVFFYSSSSETVDLNAEEENNFGFWLDQLKRNLDMTDLFREVRRFLLVTDQRVFGKNQEKNEETRPVPDTYAGRMMRLAEIEFLVRPREFGSLEKLLIRTTHLYENSETNGVLGSFSVHGGVVHLAGSAESSCDLLSWRDFGAFLAEAVISSETGIVHVFQGKEVPYIKLREWFEKALVPVAAEKVRQNGKLLRGTAAYRRFDWVPGDYFLEEDPGNTAEKYSKKNQKKEKKQKLRGFFGRIVPALELAAGTLVMQFLVWLTGEYTTFKVVDVRLLFPVVIGTVHGAAWGLAAALISYISYCGAFLFQGGELWDLLLNMDNWLPLVMYLLAGEITGYICTASKARQKELEGELAAREEDLEFVRELHQSTCDQRDMLKEQVINSQDSYGKVYNMVAELDLLNPDEITFRAIHILERVLNCRSISIFYRQNNKNFLRKIAESPQLQQENTPYSLNLDQYPELEEAFDKGVIFVNKELDSRLPAYALQQPMGPHLALVLILWKVEYQQYSRYYQNLLAVTTSLISQSMKRAVEFSANVERYIPGTILLKHQEFISAWQIRRQMQLENMGSYILFRMSQALPDVVLSERLTGCIRNLDIAGKTDDGCRYLLMMQADERFVPMLTRRLESRGISAEYIEDSELNIYL